MKLDVIEAAAKQPLADSGEFTPAQVNAITRAVCAAIEEYERQRQQEPR